MADLDRLMVRLEPAERARLDAYRDAMLELWGVRLSLSACAGAAIGRGLDALEAELAAVRKVRG